MSLVHSNKVTKTGSTLCGTIYNETTVLLCDFSSNLRKYSLNTQAEMAGSPVAISESNAHGIAVVANACALITSYGSNNIKLVDLNTNYVQSYTTSYSISVNTAIGKTIAYDSSTNEAIWIVTSGGSGRLQKINLTTFVVSSVTNTFLQQTSQTPLTIQYYKPGRFLITCDNGTIAEIDSSFTVYKSMFLTSKHSGNYKNNPPIDGNTTGTNVYLYASSLVGDLLTVVSKHKIHQISWESQQILYEVPGIDVVYATAGQCYASTPASGIFLLASPDSAVTIFEYDISTAPLKLRDVYTGYGGPVHAIGFNASGQGYYCNSTTDLVFFNLATRDYIEKTITFQDPSGVYVEGECIIYNVTDNRLHTHVAVSTSGITIQLPTEKTWRQLGIIYSGVDQKFEESEFTT